VPCGVSRRDHKTARYELEGRFSCAPSGSYAAIVHLEHAIMLGSWGKGEHPLDTIAWHDFTCPKCGAAKQEFCSVWPWLHKKWPTNPFFLKLGGVHEARIAKAALVCEDPIDYYREKYVQRQP
jgi:hypothetical protein